MVQKWLQNIFFWCKLNVISFLLKQTTSLFLEEEWCKCKCGFCTRCIINTFFWAVQFLRFNRIIAGLLKERSNRNHRSLRRVFYRWFGVGWQIAFSWFVSFRGLASVVLRRILRMGLTSEKTDWCLPWLHTPFLTWRVKLGLTSKNY